MTQRPFFSEHFHGNDHTGIPTCILLDSDQPLFRVVDSPAITVFIALGSCVVQRYVAGEWMEMRTLHRGGILMTALSGPIRLCGMSGGDSAALLVPRYLADSKLESVSAKLDSRASIEFPMDNVVTSLVRAMTASRSDPTFPSIDEPLVDAILMRLSVLASQGETSVNSQTHALPAWRLRRVSEMVKERLCSNITLADMAEAAGLSPMHFAAQFKKATGMRPHQYLVFQRIDHAKRLLKESKRSLYEVALTVGFQTQAHFSTVFKQHEQTTPARWRRERLAA
jgi:AraC family transcriptional regulator